MRRFFSILFIIFSVLIVHEISWAEETYIVIHVRANDAKFIGSSVGGALIIIRDAKTGVILDKGLTSGDAGNTRLIMKKSFKRGKRLTDDNTAIFRTVIYITQPTLITIEAHVPNDVDSPLLTSKQLWVIPGKHILGDGVILTVHGFTVKAMSPNKNQKFQLNEIKGIPIKAHVSMLCGSPITPKGIWDANKYEIHAMIQKDGQTVKTVNLKYANEPSTFSAIAKIEEPGTYKVYIYAYDSKTGNTGVDQTGFLISE